MNRLNVPLLAAGAAFLALVLLGASLFTVGQTEQVLVVQFGEVKYAITEPGLHAKVPFIQSVIPFDRRLLDFETTGEEVILSDQRRLIVDSFTRFRINDPLRYFQTVGSGGEQHPRPPQLRRHLLAPPRPGQRNPAQRPFRRPRAHHGPRTQPGDGRDEAVRRQAIEDVRLRRADLPEENTQAILNRMKSERERIARQARAEGAEASARIRADAERERTVLLSRARADSDRLRGEGEQEAIKIYADAFGRDPEFYSFYRTLQAYREAFAGGQSRLVLTPDSDFLRLLREPPKP